MLCKAVVSIVLLIYVSRGLASSLCMLCMYTALHNCLSMGSLVFTAMQYYKLKHDYDSLQL